jgi:pimeloyl-ACP methyl ester carboxylesterase
MARTFVLVHGGWCGAWVWRDLLSGLRKLGHNASAPTLTGLGERQRCGIATADLGTHIEDVVAHILMEDLREVTLVGWSYGGAVTTGTCDRLPDRIQSMIYLDAFMPANGKAVIDYNPHARIQVESAMARDQPIPPPPLKYFGVTEPKLIGFIEPRLSAQPWRTLQQPIQLVGPQSPVPVTYIACTCWGDTPFTERLAEVGKLGIRIATIASNHFCMFSAPEETLKALVTSYMPKENRIGK